MFTLIAAIDEAGGIGKSGTLPWHIPADLASFKRLTQGHIIIMGRKTWESLPLKPLPGRVNILISTTLQDERCDHICSSLQEAAILLASKNYRIQKKFLIGGKRIYEEAWECGLVHESYLTHVAGTHACDVQVTLPADLGEEIDRTPLSQAPQAIMVHRKYPNREEQQLLDLMRDILDHGDLRKNRTGMESYALFGRELSFDLRQHTLPLLTSRPLPLRHIFEELMWNIRGQTDTNILAAQGVKVWDANSTRALLDSRGLQHYAEGDIGYTYGFLMRHFGAVYKGCHHDHAGAGHDQLADLIHKLKHQPTDRRMILNLWDSARMDEMSLPPCLYNYQFFVRQGKYLTCKLTQRSSDISLAGGWNVAYGALFTYLLAHWCDLEPERLIYSLGDVHIYANQVEGVRKQLQRTPRPFPKLYLSSSKPSKIEDYQYSDLQLVGYGPIYPQIKLAMNA